MHIFVDKECDLINIVVLFMKKPCRDKLSKMK